MSTAPVKQQIERVLGQYPHARESTPFKGPHAISELFTQLKTAFANLPSVQSNQHLVVKASYGKGNWAKVPWVAILDTRETSSTQDGTYIVLLFREDGKGCHLKLAQGVTAVSNSYGRKRAEEVLQNRAQELRNRLLPNGLPGFDLSADRKLGGESSMGKLYDCSTVCSKYFSVESIPTDEELTKSIGSLLEIYSQYIQTRKSIAAQEGEGSPDTGRRYWALSVGAGGSEWQEFLSKQEIAIGWDQLPDLSDHPPYETILEMLTQHHSGDGRPTNDALCCSQFCNEISVGDVVVAKVGRKKILGVGVVASDYFFDVDKPRFRHRRKVRWEVTSPSEFPGTGTATKTLTEVTPYEGFVAHIRSLLDEDSPGDAPEGEESGRNDYSVAEIIDEGCFLSEQELTAALDRLKLKKNLILQGPPGTGKTWVAKRLAYALVGEKSKQQVRTTQFHANLSYEDFVRGYRPSAEGRLELVDGAFMTAIDDARNTSKPVVFVIEEINRGNPAQIFGEFLTLLESDKRNSDEGLELTYSRKPNERVSVPPNFYVIGTMNCADRSLALMDMALRRRFAFIDLSPNLNATWRQWVCERCGLPKQLASAIESGLTALNESVSQDSNLGPHYRIGHSYVTPSPEADIGDPRAWYRQVVETEIRPLLDEYWFDDPQRAEREAIALLNAV